MSILTGRCITVNVNIPRKDMLKDCITFFCKYKCNIIFPTSSPNHPPYPTFKSPKPSCLRHHTHHGPPINNNNNNKSNVQTWVTNKHLKIYPLTHLVHQFWLNNTNTLIYYLSWVARTLWTFNCQATVGHFFLGFLILWSITVDLEYTYLLFFVSNKVLYGIQMHLCTFGK